MWMHWGREVWMDQKMVKSYLKEVKKNCPYPFRKRLIAELGGSLHRYLEEHPDCTKEEVVAHFGAAETFGYGYIVAMDDGERKRLLNRARWIRSCLIAGVMICLLLLAAGQIWISYDNSRPLVYYLPF